MNNPTEFISRLSWVDYVALIAVLRGCWVGYRSGAFLELLRIVGYIAAVAVTFALRDIVTEFLTVNTFLNQATANMIAVAALFIVVLLVTKILTMMCVKVLKVSENGALNRLIGMILGVTRWLVILSLALMVINYLPAESLKADIHSRSVFGPKIAEVAPTLFDFLSNLSPQLGVDIKQKPS